KISIYITKVLQQCLFVPKSQILFPASISYYRSKNSANKKAQKYHLCSLMTLIHQTLLIFLHKQTRNNENNHGYEPHQSSRYRSYHYLFLHFFYSKHTIDNPEEAIIKIGKY